MGVISYLCRVEMKREAPLRTGSTERSGNISFNLKKIVFNYESKSKSKRTFVQSW